MNKIYSDKACKEMLLKDLEDGNKLNELFKMLLEENKNQVLVYLSAMLSF